MRLFSCQFREGRAESAPKLRRLDGQEDVCMMGEFRDADLVGELEDVGEFQEAEAHDPAVLPHHYDHGAIDSMFPKVKADEMIEDQYLDFCPGESSFSAI